ncbi:hypothetical protein Ddye_015583 [Dipteronia dyeriana]|uniref:Uncharacterized protein n=1 Tax=Dipteronia dyeriana TaxID=168575 RepID=A0AAD9U654_9ROSI|nr:hypothetical protein Ddye_015583 [Dipteronia dyeriana]
MVREEGDELRMGDLGLGEGEGYLNLIDDQMKPRKFYRLPTSKPKPSMPVICLSKTVNETREEIGFAISIRHEPPELRLDGDGDIFITEMLPVSPSLSASRGRRQWRFKMKVEDEG